MADRTGRLVTRPRGGLPAVVGAVLIAALGLSRCSRPVEGPPVGTGGTPSAEVRPEAGVAAPATTLPPPASERPATVSGVGPPPTDEVPPVVVLVPRAVYAYPQPHGRPMMDQIATRFAPAALVVRTGQPVDFRNDDPTLHNVRVRQRGHAADDLAFNITLPQGVTFDYTFREDAAWDVRCDVHQNMYGLVVSTSSPFAAVTAIDGSYRIDAILPGDYLAVAYTSRERVERPIRLAEGQHLTLDFR